MIGRVLTIPAWLEYVEAYDFGPIPPSILTLHHTWKPTIAQWRGLASMRSMQVGYAKKGWSAAPHIYVAPDGIWLFTPLKDIGVHAGDLNGSLKKGWYSIGIEMVGDYDRERPSGVIWEQTKAVLGGLTRRLGRPFAELLTFHRDASTKSCPGHAVTKDWVIAEVAGWLHAEEPPARTPYTEQSAILGLPQASMAQAITAILSRPIVSTYASQPYEEKDVRNVIVPAYWQQALAVGIDPVLAIAQMIHETDNLTSFWAQRPRRNPAGIGVNGKKQVQPPHPRDGWAFNLIDSRWELGLSFDTWADHAIPAQLGRLLAYALPIGQGTPAQQALIDKALFVRGLPRPTRGSAPVLKLLGQVHNPSKEGWAKPGDFYGQKIAAVANRIVATRV